MNKFFEKKGIETNKVLLHGEPGDAIYNFVEENNFDMIVIEDKGQGKVERFLLGSITEKIVHHAKTSVLVVK
jgi:nucleotide-binding universal stress UspA family protein